MAATKRSVRLACCLLLALSATVWAQTEEQRPPDQLALEGGGTLPLAGSARRSAWLESVPLYVLAVYMEGSIDPQRLGSAAAAKAIRIAVSYVDDVRRPLPFDWRRELVPVIEASGATHLRGSFAGLRLGDVVLIEYVPGRGSTVRVNRTVAVAGAPHDLMLAFLDHWLGERPVSEEIKRDLLGSR